MARPVLLLSASGDFVSVAEASQFVRDDLPGVEPSAVKAATLDVISDLLRQGLVVVGDLDEEFRPWGRDDVVPEIDRRWTKADQDLAPWDGIWIANTTAGDRRADELADDGRVTDRPRS